MRGSTRGRVGGVGCEGVGDGEDIYGFQEMMGVHCC